MTPINEVPIGKFVRFAGNICYIFKNNYKDSYSLIPVVGKVPRDKKFEHKVYIYKRIPKLWTEDTKKWLDGLLEHGQRIDNLTYVENLDILRNYLKPDIVEENNLFNDETR